MNALYAGLRLDADPCAAMPDHTSSSRPRKNPIFPLLGLRVRHRGEVQAELLFKGRSQLLQSLPISASSLQPVLISVGADNERVNACEG